MEKSSFQHRAKARMTEQLKHIDIIKKYEAYGVKLDRGMVDKAIEFAIKYHGDQKRASGEAYYHHPLMVAEIVAQLKLDSDSVVTAILHDTIEDTELTIEAIGEHFSPNIAKLVDGVTKLTKIEFKEDQVWQAENFRKLLLAISDDIRVLLVKLADRLHNMRTLEYVSKLEKRKRIAIETMEIYAPLAERIGMQKIKVELQDIAFSILNPEARVSILNRFVTIESAKEDLILKVVEELSTVVKKYNIECEISGRKKTAYSTWMKMQQKNIGIDQLSDIIAFRILVDSVMECYIVLGVIHTQYQMVPNNFQDFISTPKNNGYQSIHTVVIGPFKQKIEIQIRTKEMHEVAEIGVAAHWCYKQSYNNKVNDKMSGKQYAWIRELIAILEHNHTPDEFLQNTKLAMYYDQVFCFTPKGNLIALPKGATTVDFAYMVHSDVGNACIGAKVNGRIVPLRTELVNGDQVEILTAANSLVSPSWENFVVTGKARSEIKKAIKAQNYNRYVKLGQNLCNTLCEQEEIDIEKTLESLCSFFQLSKEDFLFAVGGGEISQDQIIRHIDPKLAKLKKSKDIFKIGKRKKAPDVSQAGATGIKGLGADWHVHYGKCCYPLPGDYIIGILHGAKEVAIHTSDCKALNSFASMPEKLMAVSWDGAKTSVPMVAKVNLVISNEPSGLAVISADIAKDGGNIINIRLSSRNKDYFDMIFDVEVESAAKLDKIIASLRKKRVVQYIERIRG